MSLFFVDFENVNLSMTRKINKKKIKKVDE